MIRQVPRHSLYPRNSSERRTGSKRTIATAVPGVALPDPEASVPGCGGGGSGDWRL
jgi:hypothetical protein